MPRYFSRHISIATMPRRWLACLLAAAAMAWAAPRVLLAAVLEESLTGLQQDWEVLRYQTPAAEREKGFETLAARAHALSEANPGRAEPLVWEATVIGSWAGEKGWWGAYRLRLQAKALYEAAYRIDGDTLGGAVYDGLGMLYHQAMRWPLGFGNEDVAGDLLRKAVALNPRGIDPNFFYGEYLVETGRPDEARTYLEKALKASPRPGRQVADTGRREEARALLDRAARARAER